MKYEYDVRQFSWVKEDNTFYADAWNLVAWMPDGSTHQQAFPNGKRQFYIVNTQTAGERRFRFVKELTEVFENNAPCQLKFWQFESEDGIICKVCTGETHML
jgi:hypothetical protein